MILFRETISFLIIIILFSCKIENKKPRIGITGIYIESSSFSPATTTEKDFTIKYGDDIFSSYEFFDKSYYDRVNWLPTMKARALPGGVVTRNSYELMVEQIIELTKQTLPIDGLFFDIHGAMNVEGMDDPEGNLIQRIRKIIGPKAMISTSMDLHGNVSEVLAKESDLITCYRMAPHEDAMESKQRALDNLIERIESGKGKPKYKAWIPVPILLPGEQTSTRVEPGKSLYAKINDLTKKSGVTDASVWVGYAWGDAPRNHAAVMAYGDDKKQVIESAETLASYFWQVREEFDFVAPTTTLDDAFDKAFKYLKRRTDSKPFIISDMGDNPTAGGAGDVTWTLDKILNNKNFETEETALIYASIPGPDLVEKALEVGIGSTVEAYIGGLVDNRYSPPLKIKGVVYSTLVGDKNAEIEVVVKINNNYVIVTKKRKPYHYLSDFYNLKLKPDSTDILVVKIGYLVPELYDIRGDWVMALTPGGVDQNLHRLDYQKIKRPMYPLDIKMAKPDLSARIFD